MWKNLLIFLCVVLGGTVLWLRRNTYYDGPISDHFDGKRFYGAPRTSGLLEFIQWRLQADKSIWPRSAVNTYRDEPPERVEGNALRVSWVGHATFLIQTQGLNILLDPWWSKRASPVSFIGPKRVHMPGIAFDKLPKIHVVLVTHNHYEHMDLHTLKRLWLKDKPRIITPLGNDTIIKKAGSSIQAEAYDLGERVALGDGIAVTLEPAQHWSSRWGLDSNHALWASFVVTTPGGNLYLVGDTGYGDGSLFRKAREKYKHFRLAILPIGAFQPRWFMAYSHMGPVEALKAYKDLGEPYTVPSHYGTVKLAYDSYGEALQLLRTQAPLHRVPSNRFMPLCIGQSWEVPQEEELQDKNHEQKGLHRGARPALMAQ